MNKVAAPSDSVSALSEHPTQCPQCGAMTRLDHGTCINCLLREGLEAKGEASREAFENILVEANVTDTRVASWSLRNPGGNRTRRHGSDLSRAPAALPSDRRGEAHLRSRCEFTRDAGALSARS